MSADTTARRVVYEPGYSHLETVMLIPPIATCIFSYLNTPDYLCVRNTTKTLRVLTDNNRRFFRNLVFLRRGVERWLDLLESPAVDNILTPEYLQFLLHKTTKDIIDRDVKRRYGATQLNLLTLKRAIGVMSSRGLDASTLSFWRRKAQDTQKELSEIVLHTPRVRTIPVSEFYHPRFMGRHLAQVLNNLPIGNHITSVVLDGTSVDTEWIQLIMGRFASTLRGLSVRDCKYIDSQVFPDWILECKYRHQPLALRWLRVWGSGGFPHVFSTECPMDPVMPLDIHPDDKRAGGPVLLPHTEKLFANLISNEFHMDYTRAVLMPMYNYGQNKNIWLRTMEERMRQCFEKFDELHEENPEPFVHWDALLQPLGEINPVIALLVISKYFDIKVDIALCASQHFCWSFVLAANSEIIGPHQQLNHFTMGGRTYSNVEIDGRFARHTHCLAEVGARKNEGGQCCYTCGLWEGSPAPVEYCGDNKDMFVEVGGVTNGAAIGVGRFSMGSLCAACVIFMTCAECDKFICQSCFFKSPTGPQNPLMVSDVAGLRLLKVVCAQPGHGAECVDCIATRADLYFECEKCGRGYCLRCQNPTGRQVSTDLYGGSMRVYQNDLISEVPGVKLRGGRPTPFAENPLCRLAAFKPAKPQVPTARPPVTFTEHNLFEICIGCEKALCRKCVPSHAWEKGLEKRPNASKYRQCLESACGKFYCENCVNACANVCTKCKTWVCCRMCDLMNNTITGVPDALQGRWCGQPDCMDRSGVGKLGDLEGPWEDGWVPRHVLPRPTNQHEAALSRQEAQRLEIARLLASRMQRPTAAGLPVGQNQQGGNQPRHGSQQQQQQQPLPGFPPTPENLNQPAIAPLPRPPPATTSRPAGIPAGTTANPPTQQQPGANTSHNDEDRGKAESMDEDGDE